VHARDPLADFFTATPRRSAGLSGRGGLHGEVDLILEQLRVPATLDADGDWHIDSDVGPFLLVVDEGGELVLIQKIGEVEDGLEDSSVGMNFLLRMNFEARGACFAMLEDDEDGELFVLTARLPAGGVTREAVEGMVADAMRLSRRLEEVAGDPAEAAPAAETIEYEALAGGPAEAEAPPGGEGFAVADARLAEAEAAHTVDADDPQPKAAEAAHPTEAEAASTEAEASHLEAAEEERRSPAAATPAGSATATAATDSAPADWYPDPKGEARLRYWDGSAWTDHTAA
jgi:hypothetical protein